MKLKPYPIYKDSGVPWLGEVPEHWDIRRLKYLLCERDVRSTNGTEQLLRVSQYTGVTERMRTDGVDAPDTRAESLVGYKKVRPDELVVNIMLAWNGSMGVSQYSGIVSPAYCVYEFAASSHPWYFHHLLRSPEYKTRIKAVSTGIVESRLRLYTDDLFRLETPVPPLVEQAAVVRFLDYMDRRIRRYIRAKQQLIKLLEEKKQVIIHRAVTRGLDPDVRLKPSGVEWLGEVPEHWGVAQIRSVAHVVRGGSPRPAGSPLYFYGDNEPWITVGEITKDSSMHLYETSTRLTVEGVKRSRTIESGTLLLTNSGATLGIPKISRIRGCINDGVAAFMNLRATLNKEFLYFYLTTQTFHLKAWVDLGAQPNLNTQIIGAWPVPLPPPDEQVRIVDHVQRSIPMFERAMNEAAQTINLLREYRTRLIADVVTGKLDVRGIEPPEMDDAEAQEDWEEDTDVEVEGMTDAEEAANADE